MKPELDDLLEDLRRKDFQHPRLHELEALLWNRVAAGEPAPARTGIGAQLQLIAVLGAFAFGILIGGNVGSGGGTERSGEILVEQVEFLTPELTRPLT